ncbi:hypothetical protein EFP01_003 [Enterococcus phage EFP01]|mgnify:FL=1|uniref:Uncharacterized protein n=1 Tax=Enterococcus phage EFP01 TaxID=1926594 RepID=A0A288TXP9_9CAUD|nr:hypothetical protein HOR47_gp003 [Enterococcus phage EFP01]APZ81930.1 hypothetical protein EFP01_003 [Enterococcus phage EFP01]
MEKQKQVITRKQYEEIMARYDKVNYAVIAGFIIFGTVIFGFGGFVFMAVVGAFTFPRMKQESINSLEQDYIVRDDIQQ